MQKEPTICEIAEEVGLSKEEIVIGFWTPYKAPVSLYEPRSYTDGGDTLYVMDQISDKKTGKKRWVEEPPGGSYETPSERERHIIDLRFFEGKTQMEVADEINISQAQVEPPSKARSRACAIISPAESAQRYPSVQHPCCVSTTLTSNPTMVVSIAPARYIWSFFTFAAIK